MTVVQKAGMRSMRIIALPLTRPIPRRKASPPQSQPVSPSTVEADSIPSPKALTYYHVQLSPSPTAKIDLSTIPSLWQYDGSVVKWMSEKAAAVWAGFGKAPEGSWKVRCACVRIYHLDMSHHVL
jgi:hypothetical protein